MKQRTHRVIIWLLIMFLAVGGITAYAETANQTAPKILFSDTVTHWSQKHVAKLAALGVVNGRSETQFAPEDTVTQQEVIVMAVRLIGAEEEAEKLGSIGTSLEFSDWAKSHVHYALHKGILLPQEEAANEGSSNWGARSAKREWVAKIMVRALGKEADAQAAMNIATSFRDNGDISKDALGYVNAAVKLGLITGLPVSGTEDYDFLPLRTIKRGEIASIFAKALQYIDTASDTVNGYVSSVSNDSLLIRDQEGKIHTISLTSQTAYYRHDQNFQVLRSDVRVGREVYVITHNNAAVLVEVLGEEIPTETITGELVSINTASQVITLKVDGTEVSYLLEESAGVIDADGNGSSPSKLIPLSIVELKKSTASNRIIEIKVKEAPLSKQSSGEIIQITDQQLIILDTVSGQVETYPLSLQILVAHNDAILMLSELSVQDMVNYKVVNGLVTEIKVTEKYVAPTSGTIFTIDPSNHMLVIRDNEGKLQAYEIATNVQVQLEGMAAPTLDDLFPGDRITLTFNSSELVNIIRIENRTISSLQMLKFETYIEDLEQIVVIDDSDSYTLKLTKDTVFEVYGIEYPITEMTRHLARGQRVDLVLTGEYVQRIKRSDSYYGTVKDFNPTTRRLVLSNPSIGDITLNLSPTAYVQIINQSSTTLGDVQIGDEVKIILGQDQQTVSQIHVKRNLRYTIESINPVTRNLTLRDSDRQIRYMGVTNNLLIRHPDKPFASINDLKVGETITVTYYGFSPDSINLLEVSYGTVESVDHVNRTLTVSTPDNQILQVDTALMRFELLKGSEKVSASTLLKGDRISIMQDRDGYTFAQIVQKQMKIMYRLESGNKIAFTNPLGEVERFDLAPNVIVRSGNRKIDLTDLKAEDMLNVYIVNQEIVEIEKI